MTGFTGSFTFGDDGVEAGTFRNEQGDEAGLVHDAVQALGFGFDVEGDFRQIEAVDALHGGVHHEALDIFVAAGLLDIGPGRRCRQPAAADGP